MSDTIDQNLWYKIRYTPIRDALRGRLSARLDLRLQLDATSLPADVKQLLHRVVKATRLWRLEQVDVIQELIAHFNDGVASGVSTDELIKRFGDERQAAQLIRRAKRRNRSLAWHAFRFAAWSTSVLLVVYSSYAIYFFSGRPSPRVNYVNLINNAVEKTPIEERAWTFYRRALIGTDMRVNQNLALMLNQWTAPEQRAALSEFVRTHQTQIAWIHQGAMKSQLGWVIGANGSVKDPDLWSHEMSSSSHVDETGEPLIMAAIPPFSGLRHLANMLRADAIAAGQTGDGKRLLKDIESTFNLSRQVGENGFLFLRLMSLATSEIAMEEVEYTLREHPALIKKNDWLVLSRRLSEPKVAADLLSFDQERMHFDDMLQRAFTDDGSGNGRLTAEGVSFGEGTMFSQADDPNRRWWTKAVQPITGLITPSRRKLEQQFTKAMDMAEDNLKVAIRDAKWPEETIWKGDFPVNLFLPSYRGSQIAVERLLGHRDGVVTGIALELYRQEHGSYPDTLNALVPALLREVPLDRITGAPIHYRIVSGRPLLYSVGADRKDDNGQYELNSQQAGFWAAGDGDIPKGDWVLYPTVE